MGRMTSGLLGLMLLAAVIGAVCYAPAQAQLPQQTYAIDWWTVDGGGRMDSQGSGYALGGTAGQPDPGVLSANGYELGGGFWGGGVPTAGAYYIYLPLVVRGF